MLYLLVIVIVIVVGVVGASRHRGCRLYPPPFPPRNLRERGIV